MDLNEAQTILNQDILTALGLQDLPQEEKSRLIDDMVRVVQNRITARIIRKLNDDDKADLDGMLSVPSNDAAVAEFLYSKIPDFNEIATEEMVQFKLELIEDTKAIREEIERAIAEGRFNG